MLRYSCLWGVMFSFLSRFCNNLIHPGAAAREVNNELAFQFDDATAKRDENAERLQSLKDQFRQAPMGQAILDYLEKKNCLITFTNTLPADEKAEASRLNIIFLNPKVSDDDLLGAIAHEARHIRQYESIPDLKDMPPLSAFFVNNFMEADAHAFQQKYLEEFAKATGNVKPLDQFVVSQNKMTAGAFFQPIGDFGKTSQAPEDYSRFEKWYAALNCHGHYETRMLNKIENNLDDKKETHGVSIDHIRSSIAAAAKTVAHMWPYETNSNYLAHLSDKELTSIKFTGTTPENSSRLKDLQHKWDVKASSAKLPGQNAAATKLKI